MQTNTTTAPEINSTPLSYTKIIGWLLILFLVPNILGVMVTQFIFDIDSSVTEKINLRVWLFHSLIAAVITAIIMYRLIKISPNMICLEPVSKIKILMCLLTWLVITLGYWIIFNYFNLPKSDFLNGINQSSTNLALGILAVCTIAPIIEELIFRGAFFSLLLDKKVNKYVVLFSTSFIFTIIHVQYSVAELGVIFTLALFFGSVRLITKNVLLCIALHMLNNVYAFFYFLITQS
ncbi:CPBP family intramembrane glutamic endopeptidase [Paraglaciecola aestuariivivens]